MTGFVKDVASCFSLGWQHGVGGRGSQTRYGRIANRIGFWCQMNIGKVWFCYILGRHFDSGTTGRSRDDHVSWDVWAQCARCYRQRYIGVQPMDEWELKDHAERIARPSEPSA